MKIKDLLKSNPITIILIYLISMLVASLIGLALFANIASAKYGIEFKACFQLAAMQYSDVIKLEENEISAFLYIQGATNIFQYALMFVLVGIFSIDYLKEDAILLKNNLKKVLLYMIIGGVIFAAFNQGITSLIGLIISKISNTNTSTNEALINGLIKNGYAIPMFITIVFFAPFVEEFVYRKSIFKLCNDHRWLAIVVSGLVFALPHMLADGSVWYVWILLFINYAVCGMGLACIYEFSGHNIYASICAHLISNLLGFLLIIIF